MEKAEFDALAAQTRLGTRALDLAEAYLCQGLKVSDIAKNQGVSRKLVYQSVQRIIKQRERIMGYPDNWVTVTATLPKPWAQLVNYIQTLEHSKAGLLIKSEPTLPEFDLNAIRELSKLAEDILRKWRKL